MRANIKSIGCKTGLLLVLPALALGFWGFIASRPGPPVPFDKQHIEQEVISQVTKKLAGRSWQGGGSHLTFREVHRMKNASFLLRPDTIVMVLDIHCKAKVPTQIAPFSDHLFVDVKLTRQKPDSMFAGDVRVPGYGFIRISFPVTAPKPAS